ncbi:MAG: hypothetical protein U1F43_24850 [Myxococcota bacterium]
MMRLSRRAWLAIAAVLIGVGGPLVFGWVIGRDAALAEAEALRAAPRAAATQAGERIARRLSERLAGLVDRESARPFFHYQNFFVDPRGAYAGTAVVPSPLADAPGDPLIAGHFQVDPSGRVTMPSVAEGVSDAAAPVPADLALLADLRHTSIPVPPSTEAVAFADPPPAEPPPEERPEVAAAEKAPRFEKDAGKVGTKADRPVAKVANPKKAAVQEVVLEAEQYQQNVDANELYNVIQMNNRNGSLANVDNAALTNSQGLPIQQAQLPPPLQAVQPVQQVQQAPPIQRQRPVQRPAPNPAPNQAPNPPPQPAVQPAAMPAPKSVVVRVGPFGWETLEVGGRPALAALRQVETPDGARTQGFVLDAAALGELAKDGGARRRWCRRPRLRPTTSPCPASTGACGCRRTRRRRRPRSKPVSSSATSTCASPA